MAYPQAAVYSAAITAALLPLVYVVVWCVLTGDFSTDVKAMVVGAVVSNGLTAITGFWLGSSASSQRKTEIAEESSAKR